MKRNVVSLCGGRSGRGGVPAKTIRAQWATTPSGCEVGEATPPPSQRGRPPKTERTFPFREAPPPFQGVHHHSLRGAPPL